MIPSISKVLAVTDLSELGGRAIPLAYAVAARGGTVHLLHVIEPALVPNPLYAHYSAGHLAPEAERARQRLALEEQLRGLVPPEALERGIRTEVHVEEDDDVSAAICRVAEALGADLVCLSSHGRTGLARVLLGSVSSSVIAHSARPTLLVKPFEGVRPG